MYSLLKRHPYYSVSIICVVVVAGVSVCIWGTSKQSNRKAAFAGNEGLLFESTESYAGNVFGGDKYRFEFPFKNPNIHSCSCEGSRAGHCQSKKVISRHSIATAASATQSGC